MSVIDYKKHQEELRRRREELPDSWKHIDFSRLTHKPRDPEKRAWLERHGLLTTPNEAPGPVKTKFRKP